MQITRITPRRLTTLQCSQIGLTLVRTFKTASQLRFRTDFKPSGPFGHTQASPYGTTRISETRKPAPLRRRLTYTISILRLVVPRTLKTRRSST